MTDCDYAMTDVPARYVERRLDAAAADKFEAHYFTCDRCLAEMEIAGAIRGSAAGASSISPRRSFSIPLSIAATVLVASIGWWYLLGRTPPTGQPAEWRGGAAPAITTTIAASGGSVTIRWSRVQRASSYAVTLFAADGTSLPPISSRATSIRVALPAGGPSFVRVDALDSNGRTVGTSSLQPLRASQ